MSTAMAHPILIGNEIIMSDYHKAQLLALSSTPSSRRFAVPQLMSVGDR
jgi:hypothetical protein